MMPSENLKWMETRDYPAYIADLRMRSQVHEARAREQIAAGEEPTALMDCFRAALIESSLRTWAANLTPEVVARAVETGVWSPEQALSLAGIIEDAQRRATMYGAISMAGRLSAEQAANAQRQMLMLYAPLILRCRGQC
jgi:hypothetical protein